MRIFLFIKSGIKNALASVAFAWNLRFRKSKAPAVMGIGETIAALEESGGSLVRFGDGELQLIRGRSIPTQQYDPVLAERLRKILAFREDGPAVGIPPIFDELSLFVPESKCFWKEHLLFCRKYYERCCAADKLYYNAFFSRCYLTVQDRSRCGEWFESIRKLWRNQDVLVVEGERSRNGVGNDLFSQARRVRRILCPPTNAFSSYDAILQACVKEPQETLFLLSIGAASKPLAYDLFQRGYRVLDIGNMNGEYEAFLQGAKGKQDWQASRAEGH